MKMCAQCGSEYPSNSPSCPNCGYVQNGISNSSSTNNNKIIVIIVSVFVVIIILFVIYFIFGIFKTMTDEFNKIDDSEKFDVSSSEQCEYMCDEHNGYIFMNGKCACIK